MALAFCGLLDFQQGPEQCQSPGTQRRNDPAVTTAGPVFRDGVLEDPLLSPNGDADGSPSMLRMLAMMEAAHRAGAGLGNADFTEKEVESPQHYQRKLSAELSERVRSKAMA